MKVHLKTVMHLDQAGFVISFLMAVFLFIFHVWMPVNTREGQNPDPITLLPLFYAFAMSLLFALNIMKISKIRKKYVSPSRRRRKISSESGSYDSHDRGN